MKLLNKVKFILLTIFFMALIFSGKSFAVTGVITDITVNLRVKPSTDSKKIMYVTQDDVVEVLEKDGEWYKIKVKGKIGYVFGKYIKVDDSKLEQKSDTEEEKEISTKTEENTNKEEIKKEEITNNIQDITVDVELKLQIKSKTDVRLIPNISSNIIYTSKKDISIKVIEQVNNWTYILVDNIYGWVRADNVIEENQVSSKEENDVNNKEEKTKIAYIKYSTVNLREKASTSSKVVGKLKLNDKVTVLEKVNNTWSKVKVDGKTGYISTDLLADKKQKETAKVNINTTSRDSETVTRSESVKEEEKKETTINKKEETNPEKVVEMVSKKEEINTSKVTGEKIVDYAKKYLGYDYKYGGSSPKAGFDCSGFTYYVYKHFGYTLSRSSTAQAKNGTSVLKSDLKPGDLLIFKNQSLSRIGHVGIYIGNNKMIHSSEPGVGVVITDLDARGYNYNKRYVTARRIV